MHLQPVCVYYLGLAAYSREIKTILTFLDMCDAQNASEQQLLEMAKREGFNLSKYRK